MIVIHHDQPERCAGSVRAFQAQAGVSGVWVVESSSRASSRRRLRQLLGDKQAAGNRQAAGDGQSADTDMDAAIGSPADVEILEAGGNVGFGPGANLGLRRWLDVGAGEWVGIAPHDAEPAAGCVARLLAELDDRPRAGLVSAEFGPDFALVPVYDHVLGGYYRAAARGEGWQDVDYPHGTLLLARRAALDDIGLFDERYFAYCEEVDLGLRARRAGWGVGLVWGAIVANGRLPARSVADYLQLRNTLLLVDTHETAKEVRARLILAVAHHGAEMIRRQTGSFGRARLALRAAVDHRRRRFGPPPAWVVALDARSTGGPPR
jgi:N-acetylglucosaminyl-diphospho-decaprenol L-rhamnosyltransferase